MYIFLFFQVQRYDKSSIGQDGLQFVFLDFHRPLVQVSYAWLANARGRTLRYDKSTLHVKTHQHKY